MATTQIRDGARWLVLFQSNWIMEALFLGILVPLSALAVEEIARRENVLALLRGLIDMDDFITRARDIVSQKNPASPAE
jgi:hypothetical protein